VPAKQVLASFMLCLLVLKYLGLGTKISDLISNSCRRRRTSCLATTKPRLSSTTFPASHLQEATVPEDITG